MSCAKRSLTTDTNNDDHTLLYAAVACDCRSVLYRESIFGGKTFMTTHSETLLAGKSGIVTGAGQGIGRAIAQVLAREGAAILVADVNRDAGEETCELINNAGVRAQFQPSDVSDEPAVEAMVAAAVDAFGGLNIACNSAALSRGSGPIHE